VGAASSRDQLSAGNLSRLPRYKSSGMQAESAPTTQNLLKLCSYFYCLNPIPDILPNFKFPAGYRKAPFCDLSLTLTPALIRAIFFTCRNIFV
jgi:hypothetical protein